MSFVKNYDRVEKKSKKIFALNTHQKKSKLEESKNLAKYARLEFRDAEVRRLFEFLRESCNVFCQTNFERHNIGKSCMP